MLIKLKQNEYLEKKKKKKKTRKINLLRSILFGDAKMDRVFFRLQP